MTLCELTHITSEVPGPPHRCYWQELPDLQVNLSPTPSGPNKLFSWYLSQSSHRGIYLTQLTEQNTRKQQYRIHTEIMSGRQHKMAFNTRQWHSIRSGHQIQDEFHERSLIQDSPLLRSSRCTLAVRTGGIGGHEALTGAHIDAGCFLWGAYENSQGHKHPLPGREAPCNLALKHCIEALITATTSDNFYICLLLLICSKNCHSERISSSGHTP